MGYEKLLLQGTKKTHTTATFLCNVIVRLSLHTTVFLSFLPLGIPYSRLLLGPETEVQLSDL
jgi:hypothetical protein